MALREGQQRPAQTGLGSLRGETISTWHVAEAAGKTNVAPSLWSPVGTSWAAFPCVSTFSAPQSKVIVQQMLHKDEHPHHTATAPPGAAPGCSSPLGMSPRALLGFEHPRAGCSLWEPPVSPVCPHRPQSTPQTPKYPSGAPGQSEPSGVGVWRRSLETRRLCETDPVMNAGSSILSFTGGIFPCQELENRGPGYHLPRGLVNHPIFQLTALVCFGRSPS